MQKVANGVLGSFTAHSTHTVDGVIQHVMLVDSTGTYVDASGGGGGGGDATAANQTTIIGHVDGIEGLLTTIDTDTGAIATSAVSIDTKLSNQATAANQTTIIGHVDGIESALSTLNAKDFATQTTLAALNAKVTAVDTGSVTIAALPNEGQQTMANSISVAIASNQSAVPVSLTSTTITGSVAVTNAGTFVVQENGAALTALQLIDNIVSGAGANISQINGVNVTMGNGASGTGVQRVTIADDSTGQVKLAAGAASIGILGANSGVDIGDVTINNASGASAVNIQDGGNSITVDYATTGSGTATGALRVELPTNGTGVIATVTTVGTITNNVNTVEVAPTTVLNGKTTVTTAGTRVVLASSTACKSVTIKALAANTGTIYVGSSTVSSSNGYQLAAGDTVSLDIANLNTVNLDSSVNGEGVSYVGIN